MPDLDLERDLSALAPDVAWPATPALAPSVTSRLLSVEASRGRPPVPSRATWTPRRRLVVLALAIAVVAALAAGARFVIGSEEIRVQPVPSTTGPPLGPEHALGRPVSVDEARASVGFDVALPLGPVPDAAYVSDVAFGGRAVLLAWDAGGRWSALPGTPWGLVVMETASEREVVVKDLNAFEDMERIRFDGAPAYWIDAPHELVISTGTGDATFHVAGNVLVWERDGVTYRLESALRRGDAIALARTIG